MNVISKLIRANECHKTRFHTERGELMPLSSFFKVPKALWDRCTGSYQYLPWIVPEAVSYLKDNMKQDWTVFEFGSGWSTIWYASHCKYITSVENNIDWHEVVKKRLATNKVANCDIKLTPLDDFISFINSFPDESFDLIVVDASEEKKTLRVEALKASMSKVKCGGIILLDDSDRSQYKSVPNILKNWECQRFVGVKPIPCMAIETSIYQRPFI